MGGRVVCEAEITHDTVGIDIVNQLVDDIDPYIIGPGDMAIVGEIAVSLADECSGAVTDPEVCGVLKLADIVVLHGGVQVDIQRDARPPIDRYGIGCAHQFREMQLYFCGAKVAGIDVDLSLSREEDKFRYLDVSELCGEG